MLCAIQTHPIQYHAPVYRMLQQQFGIPVTAIYGSDFSVTGGLDREFGKIVMWDTDLLSGYQSLFLAQTQNGGAQNAADVSARGLRGALRQLNPKAVLLAAYSPRFHQRAIFEAWRAGLAILFRGETTDHAVRRGRIKTRVRDFFLRPLYARCAKLLYVGQRSLHHFERLGCSLEKLVFSPYCVDITPFRCEEMHREELRIPTRQELGIADSDNVILFSGKISLRKGPDLLLTAAKKMPEALRRRIVLLFLGDGELREALGEEAKRAPQMRIHFVGFKNQKELSPFYHASDLLVLPSRFGETWGLVVNEALHHGVPAVVSHAVGCSPDLIEPGVTGENFETDTVDSLAGAIQQALKLINRAEIRSCCRIKVANYSTGKAAEGIARAYHQTLNVL